MADPFPVRTADVRGLAQLVTDGVIGVTDLVEALHATIASPLQRAGSVRADRASGITGLVYSSVRGVNRTVAGTLELLLGRLENLLEEPSSTPRREAVLAVLNGVLGDTLVDRGNPLAISMRLRRHGTEVRLSTEGIAGAFDRPTERIVLFVHGLCMNDLQWDRILFDDTDPHSVERGFVHAFLHYNSGLHTSINGRHLAELLETVCAAWPVELEELAIVAHSMGGLVTRSAVACASTSGMEWPRLLRKIVFLGTPHQGAPLERSGNWIDHILGVTRYSAPFSRLGKLRSAGITDLRHGNLFDEDWHGTDRFERGPDRRRHEPLPTGVQCFAAAATVSDDADDLRSRTIGDGLVPVPSALGRHTDPARCLSFPEDRQWVGCGIGHLGLLSRPEVASWVWKCLES